MGKYIKSHSNYRLSSRHQLVNGGVIYERDITTIGGISPLSADQSKIYSSGNLIMTINNGGSTSRHIIKNSWLPNETGDVWNEKVLENQTSDVNGSVEASATMNNDYMDLRSFACYGSLYMLIQNSISNIIDKFPYELYTGNNEIEYTENTFTINVDASVFNADGTVDESSEPYVSTVHTYDTNGSNGTPLDYKDENGGYLYEVSNPGEIDIHSTYTDTNVIDPLKYFANEGYKNYGLIDDRVEQTSEDGYDFSWYVDTSNKFNAVANNTPHQLIVSKNLSIETFKMVLFSGETNVTTITYDGAEPLSVNKTFNNGDVLYLKNVSGNTVATKTFCPKEGDFICKIKITSENGKEIWVYAFWNKELNVVYGVGVQDIYYHLRPKSSLSFYDNFIDSLESFEKALMGVYSHVKNTAKFEVNTEYNTGITKSTQIFVYPNDLGGYNIASGGFNMSNYISKLTKIAIAYDEKYTDNLYRVATHESLKNFDWTRNFNGLDNDLNNEYVESGEKFKSIINIMGYIFDKEKGYIDSISNVNTITYDSRANLSEYFLTDSLTSDGWITNNVYTFNLKEYNKSDGREVDEIDWSETNQKYSYYTRKFSENTTDIIQPWSITDNKYVQSCDEHNKPYIKYVNTTNDYYVDNGVTRNVIKNYYSKEEYTIPDINNEFLKRLKINSKQILRKKGTIDGVESLLSLFGMKSKRWYDSMVSEYGSGYTYNKFEKNLTSKYPYDYTLKEYSMFTEPIEETWDSEHDNYRIDYINSCKTIGVASEDGEYVPYQGLPVAYRDLDNEWLTPTGRTTNSGDSSIYQDSNGDNVKVRLLYPFFDKNSEYDGEMYYQMYGGWNNMWPYSFTHDDTLLYNGDNVISRETLRDVKQVTNLSNLVSIPTDEIFEGMICYVDNISENYAVIDSEMLPLYKETDDEGNIDYYFTVTVDEQTVTVGDYIYSNVFMASNQDYQTEYYDLDGMSDGETIKIYFCPSSEEKFIIQSGRKVYCKQVVSESGELKINYYDEYVEGSYVDYIDIVTPFSKLAFINGSFDQEINDGTNYFKLTNSDYYSTIGIGWSQLTTGDTSYKIVSSIIDEYEGNNPHSGNFQYDSGYEYLSRFAKLFKTPLNGEYFNYECLANGNEATIIDTNEEIAGYGFSGIINSDESIQTYVEYMHNDNKVHAYVDNLQKTGVVVPYDLNSHVTLDNQLKWSSLEDKIKRDGVTQQVINTKVVDLFFYLNSKETYTSTSSDYYTKFAQEEIKYIQNKILPYVEQIIPSTTILNVKYFIYPFKWIYDNDEKYGEGKWKENFYWFESGLWP